MGHFYKKYKQLNLLCKFCKGVKNLSFSCEIIFGQLLLTFGDFFLVTLAEVVA